MMNNTITEDYVSFETARLLKEKGFDVPVYTYYTKAITKTSGEQMYAYVWHSNAAKNFNNTHKDGFFSCPTIQMVMKYLREVYHLLIVIDYECEDCYVSDMYSMSEFDECGEHKHYPPTFVNCKTYEQACEAAIKYYLENVL